MLQRSHHTRDLTRNAAELTPHNRSHKECCRNHTTQRISRKRFMGGGTKGHLGVEARDTEKDRMRERSVMAGTF